MVAFLLGWLLGVVLTQQLPSLPPHSLLVAGTLGMLVLLLGWWYGRQWCRFLSFWLVSQLLLLMVAFFCAITYSVIQAEQRLIVKQSIPISIQKVTVQFTILSLVDDKPNSRSWEAEVILPNGHSVRAVMRWYDPAHFITMLPGQTWKALVTLRPIHSRMNGVGFDAEQYQFAQNVHVFATLHQEPERIRALPWLSDLHIDIQRIRHYLRAKMRDALAEKPYAAVMIALAMGDQTGVATTDWEIFRRSGITHLVSISGLHVTCIAALGGLLFLQIWKRFHWRGIPLAERSPAQIAGACAAMVLAGAYCVLAGWGVPAQRTFFMLSCLAFALILRLTVAIPIILLCAAFCITLLDPWSVLSAGFWLSFGALTLLIIAGQQAHTLEMVYPLPSPLAVQAQRLKNTKPIGVRITNIFSRYYHASLLKPYILKIWLAFKLQCLLSFCLIPLTVASFAQFSVISPIVNALAIPIVSFVVTPAVLIGMLLLGIPGLADVATMLLVFGHKVFEWLMVGWVIPLSNIPGASVETAEVPWYWITFAILGCCLSIVPLPIRFRYLGLLALLPLVGYRPDPPARGEWRMTALDVGQGTAVVVQTANHWLLVDTGAPLGSTTHWTQTILPYISAQGRSYFDAVLISHADLDHASGIKEMQAEEVRLLMVAPHMYASVASSTLAKSVPVHSCAHYRSWEWDGVFFDIIHPSPNSLTEDFPHRLSVESTEKPTAYQQDTPETNANSCVLVVTGKWHNAIFPADVGVAEEKLWKLPEIDVVLAAHHGSNTSSSASFIEAVQAQEVIFQMGFLNRYRHPHPAVWQRWQNSGARLHRSDWHGGIQIYSTAQALQTVRIREKKKRYWHIQPSWYKANH